MKDGDSIDEMHHSEIMLGVLAAVSYLSQTSLDSGSAVRRAGVRILVV